MSKPIPWMQNKELFASELAQGNHWEERARVGLIKMGHDVQIGDESHIDDALSLQESREKFKDQVDLIVNGFIVEVKSRNYAFTCPDDFPFPTVGTETMSSWLRRIRKPDFYLSISKPTRRGIVLDTRGQTPADWECIGFFDKKRRIADRMYAVCKHKWLRVEECDFGRGGK